MNHRITFDGTNVAFDCAPEQNVLDAAEAAGWSIPYSCRKGVCTTCVATLCEGEAEVPGRGRVRGPAGDVMLCQARPLGPLRVAPKRVEQRRPPARKTLDATVYRIRRLAPRVTSVELRFPIGRRIPFRAGQYLSVLLPKGDSRSYSLANSPQHNDSAHLHVRTEPGGRFSDGIVPSLRPGDRVRVRSPYGEFCLADGDRQRERDDAGEAHEGREDPVLLLATGTGFAPVRSIVTNLIARRASRPVHLYWGGRTEADLYLLDLARTWAERHPWFRFTPVLSRPGAGWSGATGWVQRAALADHPDLSGHQVYACGSPAMTDGALDLLGRAAGLTEDRFHCDAFVPSADLAPAR